jgi:hypothetical protein
MRRRGLRSRLGGRYGKRGTAALSRQFALAHDCMVAKKSRD